MIQTRVIITSGPFAGSRGTIEETHDRASVWVKLRDSGVVVLVTGWRTE